MTVCYAWHHPYEYRPFPCATCGHHYWEHSHKLLEYDPPNGRRPRAIISIDDAVDAAIQAGGTAHLDVDLRPRYQMMMDRTIGVCDWYRLRAAQEVEKQADALLVYHEAAAGDHAATIRAVAKNEMFEVTTFHDLALRQRRYIMSNGITQVVVPIPEEEP
jgi:hypothetical protein